MGVVYICAGLYVMQLRTCALLLALPLLMNMALKLHTGAPASKYASNLPHFVFRWNNSIENDIHMAHFCGGNKSKIAIT